LLGIAPVIPPRSEPPTVSASSPPAAPSAPAAPAGAALTVTSSSAARADNPLKQTLLGIAPVLPNPPAAAATPTPSNETTPPIAALEKEASLPSIVTLPASAESDAPVTRSSAPPPLPHVVATVSDSDLPQLRAQRPRWVLPLAVAAVIGLGVVGLRRLDHAAVPASLPPAAEAPKAAAPPPPVPEPSPLPPSVAASAPAAHEADSPSAPEPEPRAGKPVASATPAPSAALTAGAAVGDVRRIRIASDPPGARMFWRGKEVGTTPFTLELQPGEKHSYEMGLPGYVTRKVVVDGSKSEISIGMKPESGAATGARPRK
jgi:hypothetical protein